MSPNNLSEAPVEYQDATFYPPVATDTVVFTEAAPTPQPTPSSDPGWTLSSAFGLVNILAGLMLVAAILLFFGGLVGYLTRLGLEGRIQGLAFMYRGVTVLFVLIVLLAIVRFVQFNTAFVLTALAVVIVILGAWAIVQMNKPAAEDDH